MATKPTFVGCAAKLKVSSGTGMGLFCGMVTITTSPRSKLGVIFRSTLVAEPVALYLPYQLVASRKTRTARGCQIVGFNLEELALLQTAKQIRTRQVDALVKHRLASARAAALLKRRVGAEVSASE